MAVTWKKIAYSPHASDHVTGGADLVNHDSLTGFVAAEHKSLPNTIAQVLSNHTKAIHDALAIDHGSLGGKGDDDHSQYYNAARHTKAIHDALAINAGLVDGFHASKTRDLANTCPVRDVSGYLQLGWINTPSGLASSISRIYCSQDDYIRYMTPTNFANALDSYIKLDNLGAPDDNTDLNASTTKHGLLKKLDNVVTNAMLGTGNWGKPYPAPHQVAHNSGGSDAIKLDDLATPNDNADLNASATRHGLLRKLSNLATQYLNGQGVWAVPASSGASIKTGTYTGDGTLGQAITGVGFRPKWVKIYCPHPTVEGVLYQHEKLDQTWGDLDLRTLTGVSSTYDNQINSLDADGFTVDDDDANAYPNSNGIAFDYIAIG